MLHSGLRLRRTRPAAAAWDPPAHGPRLTPDGRALAVQRKLVVYQSEPDTRPRVSDAAMPKGYPKLAPAIFPATIMTESGTTHAHGESGHYARHSRDFYRELLASLDRSALARLQRRSATHHFLLAARQIALLIVIPVLMWRFPTAWVWVPAIVLQGFVLFGFSVLLHEVIHNAVFARSRPRASRGLGLVYGTLGFLAPSQFARWHLDHHRELGSARDDPKRAELSPKRNRRWLKLLYFTVLLAPIYFGAAARAARKYSPELRRRIARERLLVLAFHGSVFVALSVGVSIWFALAAHVAPFALAYPIAFSINRLGQHYVVDPSWPGAWTTLVKANPVWNALFLYSSHHLEHHCFPGVPCYRLPELSRLLVPVLTSRGHRAYGYGELLVLWLVRNHAPHTRPAP
jgi:fatty acid desaturase